MFQKPDNVKITRGTFIIRTDATNIDLDQVYNLTEVSSDGINNVRYNNKYKYIPGSEMVKQKHHFLHCIIFTFHNQTFKLFKNGKIQCSGRYDMKELHKKLGIILDLCCSKIVDINVAMLMFSVTVTKSQGQFLRTLLPSSIPNIYELSDKYKIKIHESGNISACVKTFSDINEIHSDIMTLLATRKSSRTWLKPWTWFQ